MRNIVLILVVMLGLQPSNAQAEELRDCIYETVFQMDDGYVTGYLSVTNGNPTGYTSSAGYNAKVVRSMHRGRTIKIDDAKIVNIKYKDGIIVGDWQGPEIWTKDQTFRCRQ